MGTGKQIKKTYFAHECLNAQVAAKQSSEVIKSNIKTTFWEDDEQWMQKC